MKYLSTPIKRSLALLACSAVVMLHACLKASDAPVTPASSLPFKGADLAGTLAQESSLQLFNRAFKRASMEQDINNGAGYTIFAPTDAAMKAAGLNEATIDKMNIDSLRSLVGYQVVTGALDDQSLSQPVTATYLTTLKRTLVTKPGGFASYQYAALYVKEGDKLYFNGVPVKKEGDAIPATNGYIYPVSALAIEITTGNTLLDLIKDDPDLSMYYQALLLEDSILSVNYLSGDISFFNDRTQTGMYPAVLSPTNKAFEDAGFHTLDDLRTYATSSYVGFDPNGFVTFYFSPLDTVLKRHIIFNGQVAGSFYYTHSTVRVFYNDLLNPAFNNGKLNTYAAGSGNIIDAVVRYSLPLSFSDVNGEAHVSYGGTAAPSYPLPRNAAYVAVNGSLFKINKLFYPIVK
ncbi:fasciclin domain-containing protein [Chitinophaga polysaccharea]|uniref:fasciclin domain-containing protein n=1 Tax=Chitinophaga polysaccharea TaxID=1293035 RepID=UPI00115976B7|nr:fasciclin domain-containing protein [Chitinophaga polysaccharea]